MFRDRTDAGIQLARALVPHGFAAPVVLALPRGGVPVAFEIAEVLHAPLDIVNVRKIGAPHNRELAIGAIVDGGAPEVVLDDEVVAELGLSQAVVAAQVELAEQELQHREVLLRGARAWSDLKGRTAIVVDDGVATGSTVRAALQRLRRLQPALLVLAVPVAPPEALAMLRQHCDAAVCLRVEGALRAVSQVYERFEPVPDREVIALLELAQRRS